ncbi:MAG: hypothetical protein H6636_01830 [Anaerolineales bacterium]|nr:hypothetical protein [Anaerolineales bacterium]
MFKKIFIGILLLTVIGAGIAAVVYQSSLPKTETSTLPDPLAANTTIDQQNAGVGNGQTNGNGNAGNENAQAAAQENPAVEGAEGDPWQATGTVAAFDDYGFDMALETGETVYVELGPPTYWQAQGITLEVGQTVSVVGTTNEGMYHANQVQLADGQTLVVRTETGQPLWSGGVDNGQGNGNAEGGTGSADGTHTADPQAQVDEWITINGTLMAYQGGSMTIATEDGEIITFQTGQPRFFSSQGVTFQVGEEVIVVGFYEGDAFQAGDITQVSTGLRVFLRDPNGRPLWAGSSNNGNGGNGNGNGGGGNGNGNSGDG